MAAGSRAFCASAGLILLAAVAGCTQSDAPRSAVTATKGNEGSRNRATAPAASGDLVDAEPLFPHDANYAEYLSPPTDVAVGTLAEWEGQPGALEGDARFGAAGAELPPSIRGEFVRPDEGLPETAQAAERDADSTPDAAQ